MTAEDFVLRISRLRRDFFLAFPKNPDHNIIGISGICTIDADTNGNLL